jgi:hypothetical protein
VLTAAARADGILIIRNIRQIDMGRWRAHTTATGRARWLRWPCARRNCSYCDMEGSIVHGPAVGIEVREVNVRIAWLRG